MRDAGSPGQNPWNKTTWKCEVALHYLRDKKLIFLDKKSIFFKRNISITSTKTRLLAATIQNPGCLTKASELDTSRLNWTWWKGRSCNFLSSEENAWVEEEEEEKTRETLGNKAVYIWHKSLIVRITDQLHIFCSYKAWTSACFMRLFF